METSLKLSENECVIFGGFVKSTRLQNNIIARDAAQAAGMLPSNFSKLEHGALAPVRDADKQKMLAQSVGIQPGTEAEAKFFDLAAKATGSAAADLADIISREEALPLLLRTIGNKRLGQKEIEKLVLLARDIHEAPEVSTIPSRSHPGVKTLIMKTKQITTLKRPRKALTRSFYAEAERLQGAPPA